MIYVTGDLHGAWYDPRFNLLKQDDYAIICGDFGLIWDGTLAEQIELTTFSQLTGNILFVDGNHENFSLLNKYPVEEWHGGLIQKIRPNVIHLMRGNVYNIDGKSIFVMGGGTSIDKHLRTPGLSWWPEEIPSREEFELGEKNLEAVGWKVDYVCTHAAPSSVHDEVLGKYQIKKHDAVTEYLQTIKDRLDYKVWYFGHYHNNYRVDDKHCLLYQEIYPIEEGKNMIQVQVNLLDANTAQTLAEISNKYPEVDADVKYGSVMVDAKSIMGLMQLVGHSVDLRIVKGNMPDVMSYITEVDLKC